MTREPNEQVEAIRKDLRYLQLLSNSFPTSAEASTEIINLEAILNLPKGTEHFLADVHGEYEAFNHVLKNASGSILRKVRELFGHQLQEREMAELATLIYYPAEKLELSKKELPNLDEWYRLTLIRLVKVCRKMGEKYTRSKVANPSPRSIATSYKSYCTKMGLTPTKVPISLVSSTLS